MIKNNIIYTFIYIFSIYAYNLMVKGLTKHSLET